MTDTKYLRELVRASALSNEYIAYRLGLTPEAYQDKESGRSQFVSSEITTIRAMLSLSMAEIERIFFNRKGATV